MKVLHRVINLLDIKKILKVVVEAVAEALKSKKLSGAAFDVFPKEPGSANEKFVSPLQNCPNTILTPHIGKCFCK